MAHAGALPRRFSEVNKRFMSPGFATLAMGVVSIAWYLGLTAISQNVLSDSILALGLGIAFYYALTGFACVTYFRRELFTSVNRFVLTGALPALGALAMAALFVKSCFSLAKPVFRLNHAPGSRRTSGDRPRRARPRRRADGSRPTRPAGFFTRKPEIAKTLPPGDL